MSSCGLESCANVGDKRIAEEIARFFEICRAIVDDRFQRIDDLLGCLAAAAHADPGHSLELNPQRGLDQIRVVKSLTDAISFKQNGRMRTVRRIAGESDSGAAELAQKLFLHLLADMLDGFPKRRAFGIP